MSGRLRIFLLFVQILLAGGASYLAWQTHETNEKIRALKPFAGCVPFHNGMALGPGECAYIIIPGPPADASTGEQL